jgi:ABC-type transport system substrate-binding protein
VTTIAAVSDETVELVTSRPDASLPVSLASPELPILPVDAPSFADAIAGERLPVGTGPFRPISLQRDEIRMLRNSWYWQIGRPWLGGLRVRPVAGEAMRTASLLTREVDLLPDVPLLDVQLCRQNPSLSVVGGASTGGCMLVANLGTSPMNDTAFRLLINAAIDRESLVKAATANEATPQQVFVPKDHWAAYDAPLQKPDIEKLKQQLRDIGYPVGLRLRMVSDERNVSLSNAAVFLQEQLAFVGIALAVELLDTMRLQTVLETGDYDLYAANIDPWRDPHEVFRPWLMSDGSRNVGGYASLKVDRLIRAGVQEVDTVRRAPIYRQLQEVLLQDAPVIVLYLQNAFDGMISRLQDYPQYPPVTALALRHAWLSKE